MTRIDIVLAIRCAGAGQGAGFSWASAGCRAAGPRPPDRGFDSVRLASCETGGGKRGAGSGVFRRGQVGPQALLGARVADATRDPGHNHRDPRPPGRAQSPTRDPATRAQIAAQSPTRDPRSAATRAAWPAPRLYSLGHILSLVTSIKFVIGCLCTPLHSSDAHDCPAIILCSIHSRLN